MKKKFECRHLINNIPNTKLNREFIAELNRMMRKSNSKWYLAIRYRSGKEYNGYNYKQKDARLFSVYLRERKQYLERVKHYPEDWLIERFNQEVERVR